MHRYAVYVLSRVKVPNKINPRLIKKRDVNAYDAEDAKIRAMSMTGRQYRDIKVLAYT